MLVPDADRDMALTILDGCQVLLEGDTHLKDGSTSPLYVDLRRLTGYPNNMSTFMDIIAGWMMEMVCSGEISFDLLCAMPYGSLPMTTMLMDRLRFPMIYVRKDEHATGTMRSVEGVYSHGDRAIIFDDVITTGASKVEAANALRDHGLVVSHVISVVDRRSDADVESGILDSAGLTSISFCNIGELVDSKGMYEERFLWMHGCARTVVMRHESHTHDNVRGCWFPSPIECRIIVIDDNIPMVSEEEDVDPWNFQDDIFGEKCNFAVAMARECQIGKMNLPSHWGRWKDGVWV